KAYYVPNNAFIVITGDFSTDEILPKIKAAFEKIPRGPEPPKVRAEEPLQKGERRVVFKREAELPFVMMFYHAPNLKSPDNFALDLLTVVLAGGRSSRLYHDLVYEKRAARSVDASYSSVSVDPGGFTVMAQLMPGKEPPEVEHEVDAMLDKIKSELISDRELQKAKNQIESSFIYAQDSIFGQAMKIGYYEATGDWRQMDRYIEGIRRVTREDIRRVAKQYLDADRRTVGVLLPTKEKAQ
ncbi:MAG TPA: pitrilysin family protein, partial [Methylomirabilota bacterium]|nr:pitrilysin family protein [Methylomirabilota bacterium]